LGPLMPVLLEEHIPLRRALAICYDTDVEDGLARINRAVDLALVQVRRTLDRKSRFLKFSIPLALIAGVAMLSDLLGIWRQSPWVFGIEVLTFALPAIGLLAWHLWQYGASFPKVPTALPHDPDQRIETTLTELQKESGPRVYTRSLLHGRYVPLDRRLFFGRLRYLVLSEDVGERSHVLGYPAPIPVLGDLFVTRNDAERLLAMSKPKRKAGPGRDPKYAYLDAVIAIMASPELRSIDLADRTAAGRKIEKLLLDWFEDHVDASADMPRTDMVRPYASRILAAMVDLR